MSSETYRLEIRTPDGGLAAFLPEVSGTWTEKINSPNEGEFRIALRFHNRHVRDVAAAPNQVWIRDGDGNLLDRLHILPQDRIVERSGAYWELQCEGMEAQLRHESLIEYNKEQTVSQHLADWLNTEQISAEPISVGTVDSSIGDMVREVRREAAGMLSAIRELHDTVGGFWWVDTDLKLNWRESMVSPRGQVIRIGKNLSRLVRREDPTYLATRLYIFGRKPHHRRLLRLSEHPDFSVDYIEGRSSAISEYGIRVRRVVEYDINNADTLVERAKRMMDSIDTPRVTYRGNLIDLAAVGEAFDFHRAELGAAVTVYDEDLDVDETVYVTEIRRDIVQPVSGSRIQFRKAAEPNHLDEDDPVVLQEDAEALDDTVARNARAVDSFQSEDNDIRESDEVETWVGEEVDAGIDEALQPGGAIHDGIRDGIDEELQDGGSIDQAIDEAAGGEVEDMARMLQCETVAYSDGQEPSNPVVGQKFLSMTDDADWNKHQVYIYDNEPETWMAECLTVAYSGTDVPNDPEDGDKFLSMTTDNGFSDHQLYEWDAGSESWTALAQAEGDVAYIIDDDDQLWGFDGSSWAEIDGIWKEFDQEKADFAWIRYTEQLWQFDGTEWKNRDLGVTTQSIIAFTEFKDDNETYPIKVDVIAGFIPSQQWVLGIENGSDIELAPGRYIFTLAMAIRISYSGDVGEEGAFEMRIRIMEHDADPGRSSLYALAMPYAKRFGANAGFNAHYTYTTILNEYSDNIKVSIFIDPTYVEGDLTYSGIEMRSLAGYGHSYLVITKLQ